MSKDFWRGFFSAFCLFPATRKRKWTHPNWKPNEGRNPLTGKTDAEAMQGDFEKVGEDMRKAMQEWDKQNGRI